MTSNEHALLSKYAPYFEEPILEIGGNHKSKMPSPRLLFPDKQYISLDLDPGPTVDLVHDMEQPLRKKFKSIICCSMLEHCNRPWLAAKNIEDCLEIGGRLFVAAPFVWRFHEYPNDLWRFSTEAFKILFPTIEWFCLKYATKNKKEVANTYFELAQPYKSFIEENTALVAVALGCGIKK